MKCIGTKIPDELYEELQKYKRFRKIRSDSEALREILRNYLLGSSSSRHPVSVGEEERVEGVKKVVASK